MLAPVHGHADVVEQRREDDDDLGVIVRQPVVGDERGRDAVLRQLAQELEPDVRDDLDVDPGVVVYLETDDRVHVRDVPPRLELRVSVDLLEKATELPVPARRDPDVHRGDRLGRAQPRLVDALGG